MYKFDETYKTITMLKIEFTEEERSLLQQSLDLSISDVSSSVMKTQTKEREMLKIIRGKLITLQQKVENLEPKN